MSIIRPGARPSSPRRALRPEIEAVDHALWSIPPRSCLTAQEAKVVLSEVAVALGDAAKSQAASDTLNRAVTAATTGALVDRTVLIDALLDLRLAMEP